MLVARRRRIRRNGRLDLMTATAVVVARSRSLLKRWTTDATVEYSVDGFGSNPLGGATSPMVVEWKRRPLAVEWRTLGNPLVHSNPPRARCGPYRTNMRVLEGLAGVGIVECSKFQQSNLKTQPGRREGPAQPVPMPLRTTNCPRKNRFVPGGLQDQGPHGTGRMTQPDGAKILAVAGAVTK